MKYKPILEFKYRKKMSENFFKGVPAPCLVLAATLLAFTDPKPPVLRNRRMWSQHH